MSVRRMLEICARVAEVQARAFPDAKADDEVERQDNLLRAKEASQRRAEFQRLMKEMRE